MYFHTMFQKVIENLKNKIYLLQFPLKQNNELVITVTTATVTQPVTSSDSDLSMTQFGQSCFFGKTMNDAI